MKKIDVVSELLPVSKGDWQEYFVLSALAATIRTDCTRRQFGCIAVSPDKRIVATGYNAPPKGVLSKVEEYEIAHGCSVPKGFGCCKGLNAPKDKDYNSCVAIHAEQNCLLQLGVNNHYEYIDLYIAGRDGQTGKLTDSKPCIMCARFIKQFNIRHVYSLMADGTILTQNPQELEITC